MELVINQKSSVIFILVKRKKYTLFDIRKIGFKFYVRDACLRMARIMLCVSITDSLFEYMS